MQGRKVISTRSTEFEPYDLDGPLQPEMSVLLLSYTRESRQGAYMMRLQPGARTIAHTHRRREEIYILEADLGYGVSLSLDFLIYREVDPFAEINGVELHLGGTIEGYRVKAIERDRVTLSNGRRTIVLRAP